MNLQEKRWIILTPDKKQKGFDRYKITLSKRLKNFEEGKYIAFYFSIANRLINGIITQNDHLVYLTLIRNLDEGRKVTYEYLSDDLGMDKNNIVKSIKNLEKQRCLVINKDYNEKGKEYNKYHFIDPEYEEMREIDERDKLISKLLA